MLDELCGAISCFVLSAVFFLCFKTSPNLVQLFRRILPHCFAEKLKKYFVDYKTSPDFPSAWR